MQYLLPKYLVLAVVLLTLIVSFVQIFRTLFKIASLSDYSKDERDQKKVLFYWVLFWALLFVAVPFSPGFVEYPFANISSPAVKLIVAHGNTIEHRAWIAGEWENYYNFPENSVSCSNSVTFIDATTEPHRLLKVKYFLEVGVVDIPKYLLKPGRSKQRNVREIEEEVKHVITALAEDFNKRPPEDLRQFTNPSQLGQQATFRYLVKEWFNQHLVADGLQVTDASFSIE